MSGAKDRQGKIWGSLSDFANYATFGFTGMVNGAVNPKDPLSKEHLLDSFGVVTSVFGVKGTTSKTPSGGQTKPAPNPAPKPNQNPKKQDETKGTGKVASYPPRTPEATAKAQNVVGELNNILGDGKRAPNPVVSVITHKNGTVSVGFSGEASPKNIETARQLQNVLNKKYGDKYTVKAEPMPTDKLDTIEGGNRVGNCAESKVVNAAHDNPSEITGMDTVWRSSKKENPYPYAENSNQMNPCLTCSDLKNIEEYMKYANANKK